jgi:hypothetical protein
MSTARLARQFDNVVASGETALEIEAKASEK